MTSDDAFTPPEPARVFDGGDLDCGSGLALMIREHMLAVPQGQVLEMISREPTVADDLPPWCRLSGHQFLGSLPGPSGVRYFMRRGMPPGASGEQAERQALDEDKRRARQYQWRLRVRGGEGQTSTVYCRNFSWKLGQPASFEERDAHPSAVEALLGALGACLATGYATLCSREGLALDDVEVTVKGTLNNVLAHLGLEEGDPSFAAIEARCFASTLDDEDKARELWRMAVARSPLAATLARAVDLKTSFTAS
ncbi:Sulfurtransferase TusA [Fundidesulfovibrio magnetotacticus]|uniref:Sulfurtransferase TusA n=1 Tax=Fundidesulfovibrio magnetotacticus TaxID=2730080 RepID=A0A6V8LKZ6_9BACT|nr:OsmC family protein [Fundidesulfovibrio magnetotacticus]GFK93363.1 Sulfurtransferase TusA [Fundidesulfovibrio magnetotacticus]